jgi:hypothetical protein
MVGKKSLKACSDSVSMCSLLRLSSGPQTKTELVAKKVVNSHSFRYAHIAQATQIPPLSVSGSSTWPIMVGTFELDIARSTMIQRVCCVVVI